MVSKKNIVIFLFNATPIAVTPWAENGIECHVFDEKKPFWSHENVTYHQGDIKEKLKILGKLCLDNNVSAIISFPPCTDLATTGAKHYEKKAVEDAFFWAKAYELVLIGYHLAEFFDIPYLIEQPRTVLGTILNKKHDHVFNPKDFGGYLPDDHEHKLFKDIYPPRDAYNKETWCWTGNGFVFPSKKEVDAAEKHNPGWKKLGGDRDKTKEIRSCTPEGFSIAIEKFNNK